MVALRRGRAAGGEARQQEPDREAEGEALRAVAADESEEVEQPAHGSAA
jgi:hypothetical protein